MPLEMDRPWLPQANVMVSTLDLITAQVQAKLCCGLIYILSLAEQVMLQIRLVVYGILFLAVATIKQRQPEHGPGLTRKALDECDEATVAIC
jgi:hypothetical protein